ncbi:MAG: glycosyltransferase family 2 protein [Myxococcota bacterium]
MTLSWLVALLPVLVLGIALFNLALWPRGRPGARFPGTVSVLIPARNEAERIEATLRSVLASRHPLLEVVVYDDDSQDGTGDILRRLAGEDSRVRVLQGTTLPEGWVGKPHACHRLAEAARGEQLVFLDADTLLTEDGLEHLAHVAQHLRSDVLTAVPLQVTETWFECLVLPILHLTYASWLPIPLVWLSDDERFLAANGQLLTLRASAYGQFGGYETVRHEVVDDMAFCRAAKQAGLRVGFADGSRMARCRMYTSAREVWEGFSKNIYEGVGGHPMALFIALGLNVQAFLLPWLTLPVALLGFDALLAPSLIGIGANLLERGLLARRYGQSLVSVLLHPVAIGALIAIGLNSWRWRRNIVWRGRVYASRPSRSAP